MAMAASTRLLPILSLFLASFTEGQLVPESNLPGQWEYQGCYIDVDRTIVKDTFADPGMTGLACITYCEEKGYVYAGTEYYHECFCGDRLAVGGVPAADPTSCNTPCDGDPTQECGGGFRLSLYLNGAMPPPPPPLGAPTPNEAILHWRYTGCYTEGNGARTLSTGIGTIPAGEMTGEKCTAACEAAGFAMAGTEYSGECFCGDEFVAEGGPAPAETDCSMRCHGDEEEVCGGPNRLTVYTFDETFDPTTPPPPAEPVSCPGSDGTDYVSANNRTFLVECFKDHAGGDMGVQWASTWEGCAEICSTLTGCLSFSWNPGSPGPCYLKNAINQIGENANVWAAQITAGGPGEGDGSGGGDQGGGDGGDGGGGDDGGDTDPPVITDPDNLPAGWTYAGCFIDNANGRILTEEQPPDAVNNTQELCAQICFTQGFNVSGTQFSNECFCGNAITNGGTLTSDADCSMPCPGNPAEKCGAGNRVTVFAEGDPVLLGIPAPQTEGLPEGWEYQGCLQDTMERVFKWQVLLPDINTPTICLERCQKYGFLAAAMQYGEECYCGDPGDVGIAGTSFIETTPSPCEINCDGDQRYKCGGNLVSTTYFYTGEAYTTWQYPQGGDAGEYSLLIGGVIIPLMTTQAINGKVVFVEKWGTGPPNTTGTYELDLSLVDDFENAWRPLHVKTDPFCAAGLTLPDVAGRLLNVGGWTGVSTEGMRVFTPSGTAGVPGNTDWEEFPDLLHLKVGRWYPTSIIMPNGSALIMGGQDGPNGAPIPSLELLPDTGLPPLFLPWLERTDPWNLYPYIVVLPSGRLFVSYYNEAVILDAGNFDVLTQLPNIPGHPQENNKNAGRTYPLEGIAAPLPFHHPFTEDMGVLACGGSTHDGIALDNCVTIYPESAEPSWTIERMPSKRVIPCMAPLPDGTYLIVGGAEQGMAGFGLADIANLNAVLYDPKLPLGHRMSVMANTTVARMYHSEAITLLDGRVLVSGSDPEDEKHPQEYRVEVFTPPYLLRGGGRPSFTIANTDWAWGQGGIPFTLGAPAAGNIEVSLLGSVTSTHGNSMGARTLFLNVNCAGTSCTVDAPPDANVAPPGWYQMFFLDDGVPAEGTFVRVGGDPAFFGEWPAPEEFVKPGM